MTEEEAKTKWCPFARVVTLMRRSDDRTEFLGVAAGNRLGLSAEIEIKGSTDRANPESARCIGSACMAWRWHELPSAGAVRPEGQVTWMSNSNSTWAVEPARPSYVGGGWHWDSQRGLWIVGEHFEDRGYCGLAGTP